MSRNFITWILPPNTVQCITQVTILEVEYYSQDRDFSRNTKARNLPIELFILLI